MRRERIGSASRRAAHAVALAAAGLLSSTFAAESPVEVRVMPGFGGVAIPWITSFLTIEVSNQGPETVRGELRLLTEAYPSSIFPPACIASDVDLSPGSTIRRRLLARMVFPLRVEFVHGPTTASCLIESTDVQGCRQLAVSIDDRGRSLELPGAGKSFPFPVASCAPACLPEDPYAYEGVLFVAMADADPNAWDPPQVQTLESYLRSGGTVIMSGGARSGPSAASPIVARWMQAAEPQIILGSKDGPFLREVPFGLGRILICDADLYSTSTDERLRSAAAEALLGEGWEVFSEEHGLAPGPNLWPRIEFSLSPFLNRRSRDVLDARIPAAFFLVYFVAIVAAAGFAARRRRGIWIFAAVIAVSAAGAAGVLRLLDSMPSPAACVSLCRYGPRGTGVEAIFCRIESTGRTHHRLAVQAANLDTYAFAPDRPTGFSLLPHHRLERDPRKVSREVAVPRWGDRRLLAIADAEEPPPFRIRAVWRKPKQGATPAAPAAGSAPAAVSAGHLEIRIERNPEYAGPAPCAIDRPDQLGEVNWRALEDLRSIAGVNGNFLSPAQSGGARAVVSLDGPAGKFLFGAPEFYRHAEEEVVLLDPILRGEAVVLASELTWSGGPPTFARLPLPEFRVIVQYCMPPGMGPNVEGEGVAWEPPIRIIQQVVELEEEGGGV